MNEQQTRTQQPTTKTSPHQPTQAAAKSTTQRATHTETTQQQPATNPAAGPQPKTPPERQLHQPACRPLKGQHTAPTGRPHSPRHHRHRHTGPSACRPFEGQHTTNRPSGTSPHLHVDPRRDDTRVALLAESAPIAPCRPFKGQHAQHCSRAPLHDSLLPVGVSTSGGSTRCGKGAATDLRVDHSTADTHWTARWWPHEGPQEAACRPSRGRHAARLLTRFGAELIRRVGRSVANTPVDETDSAWRAVQLIPCWVQLGSSALTAVPPEVSACRPLTGRVDR